MASDKTLSTFSCVIFPLLRDERQLKLGFQNTSQICEKLCTTNNIFIHIDTVAAVLRLKYHAVDYETIIILKFAYSFINKFRHLLVISHFGPNCFDCNIYVFQVLCCLYLKQR